MLLATTAIILPDVSFTVPCNTSSGITRHRLPLVQFGAGLLMPSLETMGLTNGSRRPCDPNALTDGLGFSAVFVDVSCCAVCDGGALAGGFTAGFTVDLAWFAPAFFAAGTGFTAITAGALATGAFLVSVFFASVFLPATPLAPPLATTGVGVAFAGVAA